MPKIDNTGRLNQYVCNRCGARITTIDQDAGVTPFMIACRASDSCGGTMISQMYKVPQTISPEFAWYRPRLRDTPPEYRGHVRNGGLILRRIDPIVVIRR